MLRPFLAALAVTLTALPSAAQGPAAPDWKLENLAFERALDGGQKLRVVNHWGDVRLRAFPLAKLEVAGVAQRHVDDPRRAELALDERDGTVYLRVAYSGPEEEGAAEVPDAWRKRRVDLTVYVAQDTPVYLETRHGLGQVKGIRAAVEAVSESGGLDLAIGGPARASSKYGPVTVRFDDVGWSADPVIETVTGEIRVEMPWDARFRAEIETRGHVRSDYSTVVEWSPGGLLKRARVDFGDGPTVKLVSQRGDIDLLRTPQLVHPADPSTADPSDTDSSATDSSDTDSSDNGSSATDTSTTDTSTTDTSTVDSSTVDTNNGEEE